MLRTQDSLKLHIYTVRWSSRLSWHVNMMQKHLNIAFQRVKKHRLNTNEPNTEYKG